VKPEKVEKITRAGASVVIFVAFLFYLTAASASSFRTDLRLFLS